jgi:hypothetical protein
MEEGTGIPEVTGIMKHPIVEVEGVGKVGGYTKRGDIGALLKEIVNACRNGIPGLE